MDWTYEEAIGHLSRRLRTGNGDLWRDWEALLPAQRKAARAAIGVALRDEYEAAGSPLGPGNPARVFTWTMLMLRVMDEEPGDDEAPPAAAG